MARYNVKKLLNSLKIIASPTESSVLKMVPNLLKKVIFKMKI